MRRPPPAEFPFLQPAYQEMPVLLWETSNPRYWQRLINTPVEMLDVESEIRDLILKHFPIYAERVLKVKDRTTEQMVPFRLNPAQRRFFREQSGRDIVLKARQLGMSSLIIAQFFHQVMTVPNTTSVIVAHEQKAAERLMQLVHLFYENLPPFFKLKAKYSSKYELYLSELNSRIFIVTAGEPDAIRGASITNLHCSEVAFWPDPERLVPALFAAGPPKRIVMETTANGVGGWFYDFWHKSKRAETPFTPRFYDWTLEPSYRVKLGRGEEIVPEHGLDAEQTKFAMEQRSVHAERFAQEYPLNDVECFVGKSRSVFDVIAIQEYLKVAVEPQWRGEFQADGKFYPTKDGALKIWAMPPKDPHGRQTSSYVIGADVAEGLERGDYSTAVVIDQGSMDVVATWKGHIDPDLFADELNALGRFYGGVTGFALLGVENAVFGMTTLKALRYMRYPRIFMQTSIDKRSKVRTDRFGWRTDATSKPVMIAALAGLVRDGKLGIPDKDLLEEMMTFIRLSPINGAIMGAEAGCHDDLVIAAAIAVMMLTETTIARPPAYVQDITDPWRAREKRAKEQKQYIGHDDIDDGRLRL